MSIYASARRFVLGPPKDVRDPDAFHHLSLVALLAWVGLGADGLSSSAYGPEEAFRQLGDHRGLAVFLALAMVTTVLVISASYSRIIEAFPTGGGGYVVASKLLGPRAGVVSGAALLVDYVLTITISVAAGIDALYSFLPTEWAGTKLVVGAVGLGLLAVMNLRGVKESVTAIDPVFVLFLVTHAILLAVALGGHVTEAGAVAHDVKQSIDGSVATLGVVGTVQLLLRAYALGGGTYTGIEAVSNGVATMREPRVETAKRTMTLMGSSLALTASGLMVAYLLMHVEPEDGKTMNAVLLDRVAGSWTIAGFAVGKGFVVVSMASEAALLFIAAQAGFIDGPRVMANLAVDSWLPHRFAALSDRLTMRNGVILMALAGLGALVYTEGSVAKLVVMYAINVFLTFLLSTTAMALRSYKGRNSTGWVNEFIPHAAASAMCAVILVITVIQKFTEGGWLTVVATALVVALCFRIHAHYGRVNAALRELDDKVPMPRGIAALREAEVAMVEGDQFLDGQVPGVVEHHGGRDPDPARPVAVMFVGGYSGLGRLALLTLTRMFPGHFDGIVFVSVAVIDAEAFKGADQIAAMTARGRESLLRYERFARARGFAATSALAIGTEVAAEAETLAVDLARRYPNALFVGGKLMFETDDLWTRFLHNETAFLVQTRLQRRGLPMIVLPVRVDLGAGRVHPLPGTLPTYQK